MKSGVNMVHKIDLTSKNPQNTEVYMLVVSFDGISELPPVIAAKATDEIFEIFNGKLGMSVENTAVFDQNSPLGETYEFQFVQYYNSNEMPTLLSDANVAAKESNRIIEEYNRYKEAGLER